MIRPTRKDLHLPSPGLVPARPGLGAPPPSTIPATGPPPWHFVIPLLWHPETPRPPSPAARVSGWLGRRQHLGEAGPMAVLAASAGRQPASSSLLSAPPPPGFPPLRSITARSSPKLGSRDKSVAMVGAGPSAPLGPGFRGALSALADARGALAAVGARRASPRSAPARDYPARPEVASPAAREPPGGRPGRDSRASVQPYPRPPEQPSPTLPRARAAASRACGCIGHPPSKMRPGPLHPRARGAAGLGILTARSPRGGGLTRLLARMPELAVFLGAP